MEHDFDDILSEDKSDDSFENFLKDKESGWKKLSHETPLSQRVETPTPEFKDVAGVEESSDEKSDSEMDGAASDDPISFAPSVGTPSSYKEVKHEIHTHPIAGTYTVETSEPIPIDTEWRDAFSAIVNLAKDFPVTRASVEQIIDRYHKIERAIFIERAKQHGLVVIKEYLLKSMNERDRQALLELDRKYRVKSAKKAVTEVKEKREKTKKASTGKSKGMKAADTFKSLMMSKETAIGHLKGQGIYDEAVAAYVDKIWS